MSIASIVKALLRGAQYAYRYTTHKFDAFRAFGSAAAAPGSHLLPHSIVKPVATYSPWLSDLEFKKTFHVIGPNTLVDLYRCYDLWELVSQVSKLPSGDILEVGVWRGGTGCLIAQRAKLCGLASVIYLCDTFDGVVKTGSSDRHYSGGEHSDTSEERVARLATSLDLNVRILAGTFPEQTGGEIEQGKFRLCHIDVDVYESGRDVFDWVWPRLVPSGVVVFDDYGFLSTGGITRLVNEKKQLPNCFMIHNLNGHAIFIKA